MDDETSGPITDDARAWLRLLAEPASPGTGDVRPLVQLFIDDGRARVTSIQHAAADGDLDLVRVLAHDLRGSSATFGAHAVATICDRAQAAAADGNASGTRDAIAGLAAAMSAAAAVLTAEFLAPGGDVSPPSGG